MLSEHAQGGVPGARLLAAVWELDEIETLLEPLAAEPALGLTVVRTWGFNDGGGWNALQIWDAR